METGIDCWGVGFVRIINAIDRQTTLWWGLRRLQTPNTKVRRKRILTRKSWDSCGRSEGLFYLAEDGGLSPGIRKGGGKQEV